MQSFGKGIDDPADANQGGDKEGEENQQAPSGAQAVGAF
jgi:hypothetical protein